MLNGALSPDISMAQAMAKLFYVNKVAEMAMDMFTDPAFNHGACSTQISVPLGKAFLSKDTLLPRKRRTERLPFRKLSSGANSRILLCG